MQCSFFVSQYIWINEVFICDLIVFNLVRSFSLEACLLHEDFLFVPANPLKVDSGHLQQFLMILIECLVDRNSRHFSFSIDLM